MKDNCILTAESVTEGHPDKLCDTIADAVVDACLTQDAAARVACEVMATAGKIIAAGEITAAKIPDIPAIICRTVREAGYGGNDYEVEVPYNYYICYVTLENFNLSHVPVYMMSEEQLSMYALYMSTLGNRPDLFPSSGYIGKYITNRPPEHEVPESYLDDETFAAILKEAEKYLGFPYVWGGSSPSTSFDCSGFVSYVYNQCGWSFGRLGAQGLYNICSRTSSPRPGDLVFFVGTYDTASISHVGIYVGDGWMLHCGDPISYANLNSSYWQSHLYAYGRLP